MRKLRIEQPGAGYHVMNRAILKRNYFSARIRARQVD